MRYILFIIFFIIFFIIILLIIFFLRYLFDKIYINNLINIWQNKIGIYNVQNIYDDHIDNYPNDFFLMFNIYVDYENHIHLIPFEFAYTMKYKNINSSKFFLDKNKSVDENINLILYNSPL